MKKTIPLALSDRQYQCLSLLLGGHTAKSTARILGISFRTVEHHLENIKVRLGAQSKSELIIKSLQLGFKPQTKFNTKSMVI